MYRTKAKVEVLHWTIHVWILGLYEQFYQLH